MYKDVDTLAREAKLAAFKEVGSTVPFGAYEQDNTSNGKETIEWLVLANEGNRSLLISQYALDCQQYNPDYWEDVTWETCSPRTWLNSTFLNAAFTADEQEAILKTSVDNSKSQSNSNWSTSGGNNTTDQIFLLSYAEAEKYFSSDSDRICEPTAYAKAQKARAYDNGNCTWWLRSPGKFQDYAAHVSADGSLGYNNSVDCDYYAVRPAFWINLESENF
jgi:hypothetical protein